NEGVVPRRTFQLRLESERSDCSMGGQHVDQAGEEICREVTELVVEHRDVGEIKVASITHGNLVTKGRILRVAPDPDRKLAEGAAKLSALGIGALEASHFFDYINPRRIATDAKLCHCAG